MVFNSSLSGAVVSLDSGADSVSFVTKVAGSSTLFGGQGIQTVQFSSAADLVSFDGTFGSGSLMGGSGNDTLVFLADAAVNASSVVKLEAGEDSLVFNGNVLSGQFGGGADADSFSGSVTIGNSESPSGVAQAMTPSTSPPLTLPVVLAPLTSGMKMELTALSLKCGFRRRRWHPGVGVGPGVGLVSPLVHL